MKPVFYKPTLDDAEMIMHWRLKPRVTQYMRTDIEEDVEAQIRWLHQMDQKENYFHWLVCMGSKDLAIGLVNIELLPENAATWGFYIGEDDYLNIGAFIPPYLYNYLFFELKISTLVAEVVSANESLLKLHRLHGYELIRTEKEAFSKKDAVFDLSFLQLSAERWMEMSQFHKYQGNFGKT